MANGDQPRPKMSAQQFITQQVQLHLTSDEFRAQLYDIVRHVLAAQGHNLTVEDVRAIAREELVEGGGPSQPDISGDDVTAIVRASVLSDYPTDVGGAIDAKLGSLSRQLSTTLDQRIGEAAEQIEQQLMTALARRADAPAAPAPAPARDASMRRPQGLESDISDQLLQDIYRAVREELSTLRKTLLLERGRARLADQGLAQRG